MPLLENCAVLAKGAYQLYRQGKYSAAALRWARAKEAARPVGDRAGAFEAAYWEAAAWRSHGDCRRALELLVPLLADIPREVRDRARWGAHVEGFHVQRLIRPELALLQRLLAELERLAATIQHQPADIDHLRGDMAWHTGAWGQALHHYSQGWHNHDPAAVSGYGEHAYPYFASLCCLRLAGREEASTWQRHLSRTRQQFLEQARQFLKAASAHSALYDGDSMALRTCLTNGCGYRPLEARAHLLLRGDSFEPLHDPLDPAHPAREAVRPERTQNVHDRYDNLLALVDYRLACIRVATGLPAVEDLYYNRPDVIPDRIQPAAPQRLATALRSFEISWRLLRRHAMRLDELLQCNWRTQEVKARRQRRDAIAQACRTELPQ